MILPDLCVLVCINHALYLKTRRVRALWTLKHIFLSLALYSLSIFQKI